MTPRRESRDVPPRSAAVHMLRVKVKPSARVSELEPMSDGTWLARVKSPPLEGKANAELVELIARHFGVRKAQVSIKSGASGRMKLVRIDPTLASN